ncbi:hypothetical protein Tco_0787156 [Tanacetum coccineum]
MYYHHKYAILWAYGTMDHAQALVNIKVDRALKDTMVILVPNLVGNGVTVHIIKCLKYVMVDLRNHRGMSKNGFHIVQRKVVRDPLVSEHGKKGNHGLPKQQVPKTAYQKKMISTLV